MDDTPKQSVDAAAPYDSNLKEPFRVIIRALVTDIEADPENRVIVFGQIFASKILGRPFNPRQHDTPHDELHFLPNCDSREPIKGYFMYDFNFTKDLTKDELQFIRHDVYHAHSNNGEWVFVKRPNYVPSYKTYCLRFPWGGAKASHYQGQETKDREYLQV